MNCLYTVGHSNHSIEKFIELLQGQSINALVDVRSTPYSRYLPHFNQKALQAYLPKEEIRYVFLGAELGVRPKDQSCYVDGKALYEKIASLETFQQGLKRLLKGLESYTIALMCAEKDPITCHRAILVCQHLVPFNLEIAHIHSDGEREFHEDLEDRLLKLHSLQTPEDSGQLSLFATEETTAFNKKERIHEAHQLQGKKIAYTDKDIAIVA